MENKIYGVFVEIKRGDKESFNNFEKIIENTFPMEKPPMRSFDNFEGNEVKIMTLFSGAWAREIVNIFEKNNFKAWIRTKGS